VTITTDDIDRYADARIAKDAQRRLLLPLATRSLEPTHLG
jgi:hypothetical protein